MDLSWAASYAFLGCVGALLGLSQGSWGLADSWSSPVALQALRVGISWELLGYVLEGSVAFAGRPFGSLVAEAFFARVWFARFFFAHCFSARVLIRPFCFARFVSPVVSPGVVLARCFTRFVSPVCFRPFFPLAFFYRK